MRITIVLVHALCILLFAQSVRAQSSDELAKPIPEAFCGGYALSIAFEAMGVDHCSPEQVLAALGDPAKGYSIAQLQAEAKRRGLQTLMVQTSLDNLRWRKEPLLCVTLINDQHFVVLHDVSEGWVKYVDYPRIESVPIETWETIWDGNSLLLSRVEPESEEAVSRRRMLWKVGLFSGFVCLALAVVFGLWRIGKHLFLQRALQPSAVLLLLVASGCASRTGPEPPAQGELRMEPYSIDLGTLVMEDHPDPILVNALIVNNGTKRVNLKNLELSCTCTDAHLTERALEQGKSSKLEASIKLGTTSGAGTSLLKVTTDSEEYPSLALVVRWNLVSRLALEPSDVDFGTLSQLPSTEKEFKITSRRFELCSDCRLTFEPTTAAIKVNSHLSGSRRSKAEGHQASMDLKNLGFLRLGLAGLVEQGSHREAVSIRCVCDGKELIRYNLPVYWELVSSVALHPNQLFLARKDGQLTGRVILQSDRPVRIVKAVSENVSSDKVQIRYSRSPSPRHFIDLQVNPERAQGSWQTSVVIELDHPEVSRLVLPIMALLGD